MAKITLEVEFYLDDYFTKFGFNDGNGGAEESEGYSNQHDAVKILNAKFAEHGLPLEADEYEVGSCHNNCRIWIDKAGADAGNNPLYTDEDDLDKVVEAGIDKDIFCKAFNEARIWFDEMVEGRRPAPADTSPDQKTDDPLEDR